MSNRIYVAIDTPDLARAQALAQKVRHHVGGLKLGLEFFCAHGAIGVREMAHIGLPIFLDLKLHDIPNTVAKAVQSLGPLAPAILTVHASGGALHDLLVEDIGAKRLQVPKRVARALVSTRRQAAS